MTTEADLPGGVSAPVPAPGVLSIVLVTLLFAVLHGYTLLFAVSNLVALPGVYELFGIGDAVPWWLLIIGVVAPIVLFAVAVLLGRRRSLAQRVLLLAVSLGATNAIALSIASLVAALQPAFG